VPSVSAPRRVRSLHLRAPSAALARRAAPLVEDALRTASIPDADGGRVYVVRKLSLPAVRTAAPATIIARAIEQRLSSLRACAVHASDPRAAHADVVYFDDAADASMRLLRALLTGEATAWFWRSIEPGEAALAARGERVRAALLRLAEAADAPAALPHVVGTAAAEGWLALLLEALRPEDGPALLHGTAPGMQVIATAAPAPPVRGTAPGGSASGIAGGTALRELGTPWADIVPLWSRRWEGDARALWLAATAIIAARPAALSSPQRLAAATRAVIADVHAADRIARPAQPHAFDADSAPPGSPARASVAGDGGSGIDWVEPAPLIRTLPFVEAPTTAGGLLFVVPLLHHVGLDAFLHAHRDAAEAGLGVEVLRAIALRTGTPPDDPMLAAIGVVPDDGDATPTSPAARAWIRAARRWARIHVRIGLHTLVRRAGVVSYTRTHVDVTFALRAADVRLRRSGLDLDPGWVPWLGRVVLFHYADTKRS
jgi:hypothetical protein